MQFNISNGSKVDLARIFSPTILKELSNTGKSDKMSKILRELNLYEQLSLEQNVASFFNDVYNFLSKYYKNEYIYKNTIIKNILLGRHSLNTAYVINECRIGKSRADSVILNGTSTVYEIKSEYDTFLRLEQQLNDYKLAFEYVYIVVPTSTVKKLKNSLKDFNVGILELNNNDSLTKIREAKSNKEYFDKNIIFDILNQREYKSIVHKYFNNIPIVPNTKTYSLYREYFNKLDIEIIHLETVKSLKLRGNNKFLKDFVLTVPDSLKALALQTNLTKKAKLNLLEVLKKEIRNII